VEQVANSVQAPPPTRERAQALLREVVQRMTECAPVAVVGEAMWGDDAGAIHVLQVDSSAPSFAY
jgi:hypothetical protein